MDFVAGARSIAAGLWAGVTSLFQSGPVREGTAAGIAAALILGLAGVFRTYWREVRLVRKLKNTLKKTSVGSGITGITATVWNHTGREIRARGVALRCKSVLFEFNSLGPESTKSALSEVLGKASADSPGAPFPTVPPQAGFEYVLPAAFVTAFKSDALDLRLCVDYDSYWGDRRVLVVTTARGANELTKQMLASFKGQFESGTLNEARSHFHLPPIPGASLPSPPC